MGRTHCQRGIRLGKPCGQGFSAWQARARTAAAPSPNTPVQLTSSFRMRDRLPTSLGNCVSWRLHVYGKENTVMNLHHRILADRSAPFETGDVKPRGRREFVKGLAALAGSAGLFGLYVESATAEPPPETAR